MRVLVLAGGFGGARMAHGFAQLDGVELSVVVNTGDDLELHGLSISPDLDTVMYTLAGLANRETGWGVRDETWSAAEMFERYGAPTWFGLGDRDLATHIVRSALLRTGQRLTEVTARLAGRLGIAAAVLPMTDEPVRTKIRTAAGWLDFQDYFVRRSFADRVLEVRFDGVEAARPTAAVLAAIERAQLIVIAPSNPFVSVAPLLAVPGLLPALCAAPAPTLAISPLAGGTAFRGPAAAMLESIEGLTGSAGVAAHYAHSYPGLVDTFVIDEADAAEAEAIGALGLAVHVEPTRLAEPADRRRLAERLLDEAVAPAS
jgi:LPPG:FO 2-phospho-L-lactate transferase